MAKEPAREFGKRRPAPIPTAAPPVKRSSHVALLLMGTMAVGGGAYALMPGENCGPRPGMAADQQASAECPPRGSSGGSHGGSGGSWSRSNFFSGDSSSSRVASSESGSESGVTRGGFGSFARAFASHFGS
jgi:hypothetical protein